VIADIDTCKNAQGQAAGLPNLAGIAFPPLLCDKNTWVTTGAGSYCATARDNPQAYTLPVGDYRYYTTHFQGLHGIWVYDGDVPSARITQVPGFQIGSGLGIKKDGQGFYTSSDSAPQSALTPTVQVLKQDASTFAFNEAYSGHTVEVHTDYRRDGRRERLERSTVIGVHDPPVLEVRDYLLDHPADLVDLCIELLLPVRRTSSSG